MAHSGAAAALRWFLGICFIAFTTSASAAIDLSRQVDFNVQAQPLTSGIIDFSRQADIQIMAAGHRIDGVTTKGVRGRQSIEQGLRVLLDGTGIGFSVAGERTISLTPANARSSEAGPAEAAVAVAATASSTADRGVHRAESISVTARKREERLLDVPLSVAVVTAEEIDRRGMVGAEDYLRGIPGVNHTARAGGQQAITIRGMETSPVGQNFSTGAPVATYFGETPTTSSAGINGGSNIDIKLIDIERVEVLRGPQGTSFGSSSIGGAVRTIPMPPKLGSFEGRVAGGYSATSGNGSDNYMGQAVINVPLVKDTLAIRGVAYRFEDSGFYRNLAGSDPAFQTAVVARYGAQGFNTDEREVGTNRFMGGRISALFRPTADLRLTLGFLTQKSEQDGIGVATMPGYEQAMLQVAPENIVRGQMGGAFDMDIDLANATVEYDFGWASLLGTFSSTDSGTVFALPFRYAALDWPASFGANDRHREHNAEVRLTTQLPGAWNLLGGIYIEELKDISRLRYYYYGPRQFQPLGTERLIGVNDQDRKLEQRALFGEASWELLRNFTLSGGVRAYEYERSEKINTAGALFGVSNTEGGSEESGRTYRANLSFKPHPDALVYALFSQGFRMGKPQAALPASVCDLNGDGILDGTGGITIASTGILTSDSVDNYELGAKFAMLDGRFVVSGDVYRMEWADVPVRVLAPGTPGSTDGRGCGRAYNANAGEARSEGIEIQATFYLTPALRMDVGGSALRARLTADAPALNAPRGARLPGSPKTNANLSLQYEFGFAGHKTYIRADSIYVGTYHGSLPENALTKAGGYVKLDLSARVFFRKLYLDLFVRNATNRDDFAFRGASAAGEFFGFRLQPRTIGFQVGYTF